MCKSSQEIEEKNNAEDLKPYSKAPERVQYIIMVLLSGTEEPRILTCLFIVAKTWDQPMGLPTDEAIKKMRRM